MGFVQDKPLLFPFLDLECRVVQKPLLCSWFFKVAIGEGGKGLPGDCGFSDLPRTKDEHGWELPPEALQPRCGQPCSHAAHNRIRSSNLQVLDLIVEAFEAWCCPGSHCRLRSPFGGNYFGKGGQERPAVFLQSPTCGPTGLRLGRFRHDTT